MFYLPLPRGGFLPHKEKDQIPVTPDPGNRKFQQDAEFCNWFVIDFILPLSPILWYHSPIPLQRTDFLSGIRERAGSLAAAPPERIEPLTMQIYIMFHEEI